MMFGSTVRPLDSTDPESQSLLALLYIGTDAPGKWDWERLANAFNVDQSDLVHVLVDLEDAELIKPYSTRGYAVTSSGVRHLRAYIGRWNNRVNAIA